jgi:hypothetical protein
LFWVEHEYVEANYQYYGSSQGTQSRVDNESSGGWWHAANDVEQLKMNLRQIKSSYRSIWNENYVEHSSLEAGRGMI